MAFRSDKVHSEFCDGLSVLESLKNQGKNLIRSLTEIFNRPSARANVPD
jgi:hypothetical protein